MHRSINVVEYALMAGIVAVAAGADYWLAKQVEAAGRRGRVGPPDFPHGDRRKLLRH